MEKQESIKIKELRDWKDLKLLAKGDVVDAEFRDYNGKIVIVGFWDGLIFARPIYAEEGNRLKIYSLYNHEIDNRPEIVKDGRLVDISKCASDMTWCGIDTINYIPREQILKESGLNITDGKLKWQH